MKIIQSLILAYICVVSSAVYATKISVWSTVDDLLVSSDYYGGCMASTPVVLADIGLNCPGKWISFSCDGTFNKKDLAYHMFDLSQVSFVTKNKVYIKVDDLKKHNGYCVAESIYLLKEQ